VVWLFFAFPSIRPFLPTSPTAVAIVHLLLLLLPADHPSVYGLAALEGIISHGQQFLG
jgi:hypothetical protein